MFNEALKALLQKAKRIAIIGAKDKPGQPVDRVGRYLIAAGYTVYPVHPIRQEVWGIPASADCASLPEPVDIINLFRASAYCPAHAAEVLALPWQPLAFWMQEGITSPQAGMMLAPKGIRVIENLCIKTEHIRLLGDKS